MNMELGSEATRAILIKYRKRLKHALVKHETICGENKQIILLAELCDVIEKHTQQNS